MIITYSYLDQYKQICGFELVDYFGQTEVVATPYPLFITITQSLSAGAGLVPGDPLVPLGTLTPSNGFEFSGSVEQSVEYNITITQSGGSS